MLEQRNKGLGFAVGLEPLPSYFAPRYIKVLATDLWEIESAEKWYWNQNFRGNQKRAEYRYGLCSPRLFEKM